MAYHTTIYGQLLTLFSRLDFIKIVNAYNGDHRVRTLTCRTQLIHLLFSQIGGHDSLRDTVDSSSSLSKKLYHLGGRPVSRSTLSDANNKRDSRIYEDLFYNMYERACKLAPKYKLDLPQELYMMDSTTIDLCQSLFPWARFRKNKSGIKLHTLLKADGALPAFIRITEAKMHDGNAAKEMPVPKGSYLVFDKAYHDFEQYKQYKNRNIRFVTRMKTNAAFRVLKSKEIDHANILSDEIIEFTGYLTHKKYPHPLRKIVFWDEEKNREIIFLTNDLSLPAKTVADIYKARWEIELFFKTIKQNLKIKRFIGCSENAVRTQIWVAMIAYLLISFLKFSQKSKYSIQTILRIIRTNLFERRCLIELMHKTGSRKIQDNQIALFQT
jgi:putative transposase